VTQWDSSSASCRILKRELEVEGILLSIVVAGLITCRDYFLSANVIGTSTEKCGDGGGGKQRCRWR
jgi:hypothetical protein